MKRIGILLALAALYGCETKPSAPVLVTEAVYTNDSIGLTFVAPDAWILYAKAILPEGMTLTKPMRLAAYEKTDGVVRADLELYAIERKGDSLLDYLTKSPIGPDKWTEKSPPETITLNGVSATRYSLTTTRAEMRREITAFERGDRTYAFVLTHKASDTKHREQSRRAIETVVWK